MLSIGNKKQTFFKPAYQNNFFPSAAITDLASNPDPQQMQTRIFLDNVFETYESSQDSLSINRQMTINLVKDIVMTEYDKAVWRQQQPSGVFHLIDSASEGLTWEQRLDWICERFYAHPAMPVITAHPTRVLSNAALFRLHDITVMALALKDLDSADAERLQERLTLSIKDLLEQPLLPVRNLTPQEEAETALFIYQNIIDAFPDFFKGIVEHFVTVHGGEEAEVARILKPAVMASFRNIHSWVRGDADGNHQVTAETMTFTVPAQQVAVIELYLKRFKRLFAQLQEQDLANLVPRLESVQAYLQRCVDSIHAGIWFDVAGSEDAKVRLIEILQQLILDTASYPLMQKDIVALQDLIELEGFFGGMKEFVRQTTKVNGAVLDDLIGLLATKNAEIFRFLQDNHGRQRAYQELTWPEKLSLHDRLSSQPGLFAVLKHEAARFSEASIKELKRLLFVSKHNDIFTSYISSDTEDKVNANEMLILMHFAAYLDGSLRIGQVREYPVNTLPLCETPRDLGNFDPMFRQMLADPHQRKKMAASGFVSYVSGPSDLGKVGGIMVYLQMIRNQLDAEMILNEFKSQYPELKAVQLRVLHGFGGDMKRRFGSAQQQSHSTFQGWAAYDVLGAPGAFSWYLNRVMAYPSENHYKVQELRSLKTEHPEAFQALVTVEKQAVTWFEAFISRSDTKALLVALTDFNLEKKMNISSRAGSKQVTNDPTKVRAIGLVNLYLLAGINWDIFMSVFGLVKMPPKAEPWLPLLFERSTGVKDIVYKVFFSIAVSDFVRAWQRIMPQAVPTVEQKAQWTMEYHDPSVEDKELYHSLAFIEESAYSVLQGLTAFLPELQQRRAQHYWSENPVGSKSSNATALELMDALGADFTHLAAETRDLEPRFQRLAICVDAYHDCPNAETEQNAVLACRGYQLAEGPRMISELMSLRHQQDLGLRAKEELITLEERKCNFYGCR